MNGNSKKMAQGAAWMVGFKLIERSIGLASTLILVRLLEPGDFGLVALATSFLALLTLLTSFSFDVALIQKKSDDNLYNTAWTCNVIFGFLLGVILTLSAVPLSKFYDEPRLENIVYIFALSTFLGGFSNIGPVAFRKELEFHKEFYFLLAKKIFAFTSCMAFAFTLKNYWALVFGTFFGRIFEVLLSFFIHPYRPRFCLSKRGELFGYSMWLFFNNSIFFTYHRLADFIISKTAGSHALGVYSIAYELSNLPTTELVAPINRAVMPGYSKISHDISALRQAFIQVLSMIALCAMPAGIGIAIIADNLVAVALGEKWTETIPLIKILAISGVFIALQTNTGSLYMAIGKPKLLTITSLIHVFLIFLPLLIFLLKAHSTVGIAEAYLYSNIAILPINFWIFSRTIKLKLITTLLSLWRPIASCLVMYFLVTKTKDIIYIYNFWINDWKEISILFLSIFTGAITYISSILLLWFSSGRPQGAEMFLIKKLNWKSSQR